MTTQSIPEVEFECVPWNIKIRENEQIAFAPRPGTWTLMPSEALAFAQFSKMKGLLSCPRCGNVILLPADFGQTQETHDKVEMRLRDARIVPELQCTAALPEGKGQCLFACKATLLDWDKRKLYCVQYAIKNRDPKKIKGERVYMHVESREEAISNFWASHNAFEVTLVDAAPVIGYYQHDKDGKVVGVEPPKVLVKPS